MPRRGPDGRYISGRLAPTLPSRYDEHGRWGRPCVKHGNADDQGCFPSCGWAVVSSPPTYREGLRGAPIRDPADDFRHDPAAEVLKS